MVKISPADSNSSESSAQLISPGGRFLTTTMKRQPHSYKPKIEPTGELNKEEGGAAVNWAL
jgi:hypothetical protein